MGINKKGGFGKVSPFVSEFVNVLSRLAHKVKRFSIGALREY